MTSSLARCAVLAALACGCALPAQAGMVVSFNPSASHVDIGSTVSVDLRISGLGDEILSATDINMLISGAAAANFAGIAEVGVFGPGATGSFDTMSPSVVAWTAWSVMQDDDLAAIQGNDLLLATFWFQGVGDGITTLSLGLDPDFERNFVGRNAVSLDVNVGTACIAVGAAQCNTVPEPAGYGLAGMALLAAALVGRRRR